MGSTVLRVKLATAPLHLSLTFSYTNILGIVFYSLVHVIICLCFLFSSRLFYFVHTLFCIYCLWWLQWSLMLPGAIGTEPYNKPHTPHSHRNRYRWGTHTPSVRCDTWTGPSTYIWLCVLITDVICLQATAEQIRLAQMIYDKNDADFEGKVQQVSNIKRNIVAKSRCFVNGSCLYSSNTVLKS